MAKANDVIENPVVGDVLTFLTTSADTAGESVKMHLMCIVGAQGPPLHYHPRQSETFVILNGMVGFIVNGQEHILTAGQTITAEINVPHKFFNAGDTPFEMTVEVKPALGVEFFLETMYSLAKQGKVKKDATPSNFLQFMTILHEYYGEFYVVGPPVGLQKMMAKTFGGFGKLVGYKGFVPYTPN